MRAIKPSCTSELKSIFCRFKLLLGRGGECHSFKGSGQSEALMHNPPHYIYRVLPSERPDSLFFFLDSMAVTPRIKYSLILNLRTQPHKSHLISLLPAVAQSTQFAWGVTSVTPPPIPSRKNLVTPLLPNIYKPNRSHGMPPHASPPVCAPPDPRMGQIVSRVQRGLPRVAQRAQRWLKPRTKKPKITFLT